MVRDASLTFGGDNPFSINLSLLDKNEGEKFMHSNSTSDPSARVTQPEIKCCNMILLDLIYLSGIAKSPSALFS